MTTAAHICVERNKKTNENRFSIFFCFFVFQFTLGGKNFVISRGSYRIKQLFMKKISITMYASIFTQHREWESAAVRSNA